MHLIFRTCSRSESISPSSLDTSTAVVPDVPFKPLEFWHIASHDRKTLTERIAPYMVTQLPKKYLIQTVVAECGWSGGIFSPEPAQTGDDGVSCWQRAVSDFWESPSQTTENLLLLAQAWFYTLLRHTYRVRFSARGKRCGIDPIVGNVRFCRDEHYTAGLTEREVARLIGSPKKYGATFYRSCYRDVRHCSEWKTFCTSVLRFCKSIQFPTHSDCPEQILKELGGNLPAVVLQRRWSHTAVQLAETSNLAIGTADYIKRLDAKTTFDASSSLKRMKRLEQEIGTLRTQCKELSLACATTVESKQCVSMLSKEFHTHRRASATQLESLRKRVNINETSYKRSIATLAERLNRDHEDPGGAFASKEASPSLESLVTCRWLLENLPAASDRRRGFGIGWGLFWKAQWSQCQNSAGLDDHPLRTLKGDEKYNKVGKNLYGTLSNVLHGYGHLHNVPLHPDVQTMIKAIGPIHYNKDEQIDIEAERRRWLT